MRHRIAATVFLLFVGCTATVRPDARPIGDPARAIDDAELDERLRFLTAEIAKNARNARAWHGVFVTMYGAGLVVESARAVAEPDAASRADYTIGAAKAFIGITGRMARPLRAVGGSSPEDVAPGDDRGARLTRLRVAEAMLRVDAHESDRRYSAIGHSLNIGLNVIGALIIGLYYHDWIRAAQSGGVGIAVGELSIWTQPWKAKSAWKRYKHRYEPVPSGSLSPRGESITSNPSLEPNRASTLIGLTF